MPRAENQLARILPDVALFRKRSFARSTRASAPLASHASNPSSLSPIPIYSGHSRAIYESMLLAGLLGSIQYGARVRLCLYPVRCCWSCSRIPESLESEFLEVPNFGCREFGHAMVLQREGEAGINDSPER